MFIVPALIAAAAFIPNQQEQQFIRKNFSVAQLQLKKMLVMAGQKDSLFPRTVDRCETLAMTSMYDWTSGFFPGNLWYAYQATGDPVLKQEAIRWTEKLEALKHYREHHDLGFMLYCSYGNAYRLTGNPRYRDVIVEGAKSLSTRFNPKVGSIKSWNLFRSWDGKTTYNYPVIIDNMLNLELLFFASRVTGDPQYRNIAMQHADNVLKNQLRKDYSCFHVVCYDSATGKVMAKETAQGYANNSTWARGQAWGIYGFTMAYRETKAGRYLDAAKKMADYYLDNPALPGDQVPYWDFNALDSGYTPGSRSNALAVPVKYRDASAAAVTASALLELSTYAPDGQRYRDAAVRILHSLSSPSYLAAPGSNCGFLLKHSVGSIPHTAEIDVPLVYADYYFLEALNRYDRLLAGKPVLDEPATTP